MGARSHFAEIAVIGGGLGGCAAALAALESGFSVIMTEETRWIGGQLTSQMVPPDEHGWIEYFGATASYRQLRQRIREYYRKNFPLRQTSRAHRFLNPGNGWVSPLCHEPKVALAALGELFEPFVRSGRLLLFTCAKPLDVSMSQSFIQRVTVGIGSGTVEICARFFVDATELGDLLELGCIEHVIGQESHLQHNEPSAPDLARPENVQAFSWCFAIGYDPIRPADPVPPQGYVKWREFRPKLQPTWPGQLLSWEASNPRTLAPVKYRFDPEQEEPSTLPGMWTYRRILDRQHFEPGAFHSDVVCVNWPMIDCLTRSLFGGTEARKQAEEEAKQLSLAALHWLQTEAPRPNGGAGWPGVFLRGDVAGTADGLAMAPYVRESRRIQSVFTVSERHVAQMCRGSDRLGERFEDSVGIGCYRIDLHPTTCGDNYIDIPALPFRIPLGALIPVRVENLLPGAKNIGTTHITNGCYRLHPVEWNIGEAVGALAAFCCARGILPRDVLLKPDRLKLFQKALDKRGVELSWPENLELDDGDPHAHVRPERYQRPGN